MIRLHRLGHDPQPFHLNPDLVVTVEANPDTVVTLATGTRMLVCESPDEVADLTRAWRVSVLDAMARPPRRSGGALSLVSATGGEGGAVSLGAIAANEDEQPSPRSRRS
jgi:flagellar protein FlbD